MRKFTALFVLLITLVFAQVANASRHSRHVARLAINNAFCGGHPHWTCGKGQQAWNVADCETGGTFSVYAGYGKHEYWGLFQMGSSERQTFGFAFNAWAQARGAKRYYNYEIRHGYWGWSPWDCLPY